MFTSTSLDYKLLFHLSSNHNEIGLLKFLVPLTKCLIMKKFNVQHKEKDHFRMICEIMSTIKIRLFS